MNQNAAMTNVRRRLSRRKDVVMTTVKLSSVLLSDERIKRETIKGIRRWAQAWETQKRVLVIANVITVLKASAQPEP